MFGKDPKPESMSKSMKISNIDCTIYPKPSSNMPPDLPKNRFREEPNSNCQMQRNKNIPIPMSFEQQAIFNVDFSVLLRFLQNLPPKDQKVILKNINSSVKDIKERKAEIE